MRLVRGRLWVALLAIILTLALAGTVSAATVAATASVTPQAQYLGDTTGTAFTFTINNTGTAGIGAVEIRRPSNAWAIVGCPQAPAGWTAQQSTIMCRYRSADAAADDIQPGQSVSTFTVKATTQGGTHNRSGTWLVSVSESNRFDSPSQAGATPATPNSLTVTVYSWQILDAVVSSSAAAVGSACPAPNPEADGGST
ncbi:MAG TPA: hypothetical protein VER55_11340, partial [Ardenticatenaceae bacterium]|nr:hypothetical protein [Ardenticatenaceae bacterium]